MPVHRKSLKRVSKQLKTNKRTRKHKNQKGGFWGSRKKEPHGEMPVPHGALRRPNSTLSGRGKWSKWTISAERRDLAAKRADKALREFRQRQGRVPVTTQELKEIQNEVRKRFGL